MTLEKNSKWAKHFRLWSCQFYMVCRAVIFFKASLLQLQNPSNSRSGEVLSYLTATTTG
jgi:hypothetical protein